MYANANMPLKVLKKAASHLGIDTELLELNPPLLAQRINEYIEKHSTSLSVTMVQLDLMDAGGTAPMGQEAPVSSEAHGTAVAEYEWNELPVTSQDPRQLHTQVEANPEDWKEFAKEEQQPEPIAQVPTPAPTQPQPPVLTTVPKRGSWSAEKQLAFQKGDIVQIKDDGQILANRHVVITGPSAKVDGYKGYLINPKTGKLQGTHITLDAERLSLVENPSTVNYNPGQDDINKVQQA